MKKTHALLISTLFFGWMNTVYADEQSCNKSYDYCMSSCEIQYNHCTTNNNDESYCKEQYQPCIQGCSNTRDSCLSQ